MTDQTYTRSDRTYTTEESEFLKAIDDYKRINKRSFPTWSEILSIAKSLGYRKIADSTELPVYEKHSNQYTKHRSKDSEVSNNDRDSSEQDTIRIHSD